VVMEGALVDAELGSGHLGEGGALAGGVELEGVDEEAAAIAAHERVDAELGAGRRAKEAYAPAAIAEGETDVGAGLERRYRGRWRRARRRGLCRGRLRRRGRRESG